MTTAKPAEEKKEEKKKEEEDEAKAKTAKEQQQQQQQKQTQSPKAAAGMDMSTVAKAWSSAASRLSTANKEKSSGGSPGAASKDGEAKPSLFGKSFLFKAPDGNAVATPSFAAATSTSFSFGGAPKTSIFETKKKEENGGGAGSPPDEGGEALDYVPPEDDTGSAAAPAASKPLLSAPTEPQVTGEEDEEVLFEVKAKLFKFGTAAPKKGEAADAKAEPTWLERGLGRIHVNRKKTGADAKRGGRLIMRLESTKRLILNAVIPPPPTDDSKPIASVDRASKKSVRLTALEVGDDGSLKVASFLLKVGAEADAARLHELIGEMANKPKQKGFAIVKDDDEGEKKTE